MKTITRKDWIEALRSGKFKQDGGTLVYKDGSGQKYFCCLGVACEIAEVEKEAGSYHFVLDDDQRLYLPSAVNKMLNLSFEDEKLLAHYNDSEKKSFNEIADIIEAAGEGAIANPT